MYHGLKPTPRRVGALATLLGLSGAVLVWLAVDGPRGAPPEPAAVHAGGGRAQHSSGDAGATSPRPSSIAGTGTGVRTSGGVPDLIVGSVLPASTPVSIEIPRIGVRSDLEHLGLDSGGAMDVPFDPDEAGWYDLGPTPGELGPAVIAGHVTWNLQRAVFFRLGDLRRGDRLRVVRRDGLTGVFEVSVVRRFPKVTFPTKAVFGTIDFAGLRVITCGGTYDYSTHRYRDNIVVFARLVGVRGARR
jgi:hypothetical protein